TRPAAGPRWVRSSGPCACRAPVVVARVPQATGECGSAGRADREPAVVVQDPQLHDFLLPGYPQRTGDSVAGIVRCVRRARHLACRRFPVVLAENLDDLAFQRLMLVYGLARPAEQPDTARGCQHETDGRAAQVWFPDATPSRPAGLF